MQSHPEQMFLRKHPILVLAAINAAAFVILLFIVDWALSLSSDARFLGDPEGETAAVANLSGTLVLHPGSVRSIRLREWPPLSRVWKPVLDDTAANEAFGGRRAFYADIDSEGYIAPSRVHAAADLEIVFLGGSTTECFLMEAEQRFPYRVGRLLEAQLNIPVNAYNGGMAGNTTLHAIDILLNKVAPLKPRFVVLMENINDLVMLLYYGTYHINPHSRSLLTVEEKRSPTQSTRAEFLYQGAKSMVRGLWPTLYSRLAQWRQGAPGTSPDEFSDARRREINPDPESILRQYSSNLRMFVSIARELGAQPVLMTQHNRFTPTPDDDIRQQYQSAWPNFLEYDVFAELYGRFNDAVRETGRVMGVPVIDLDRLIPKSRELIFDTVHLSASGSALASEEIAHVLSALYGQSSTNQEKQH